MYINSNFSDYYDFCTKYGQDPKIIYNRKTLKVPVHDKTKILHGPLDFNNPSHFPKLCTNAVAELNPLQTYNNKTGWSNNYPISFYCIGGNPYFLIHETQCTVSFAEAWEYKNDRHQKRKRKGYFSNYSNAVGKNFEALCKPENYCSLHEILGVPLFGLNHQEYNNPKSWTLNPCLKDIKFPIDPVVVYTQIFNSLQAREPQILEVQNKYKVIAHGMDNGSFKREPGGPTRKRKKIKLGMI